MCETTCYYGAISRKEFEDGSYEYMVDGDLCIGCGFLRGYLPLRSVGDGREHIGSC